MVQAILDGRKTQTRRVVKNAPTGDSGRLTWKPQRNRDGSAAINGFGHLKFVTDAGDCFGPVKCPYGKVGDRLWVRESFSAWFDCSHWYDVDRTWRKQSKCDQVFYRATHHFPDDDQRWIPSIFMSRWASRITLEITDIRVERLQDISEDDAEAEGVERKPRWQNDVYGENYHDAFHRLWDKINGKKHPWSSNPWVWAISFKRI